MNLSELDQVFSELETSLRSELILVKRVLNRSVNISGPDLLADREEAYTTVGNILADLSIFFHTYSSALSAVSALKADSPSREARTTFQQTGLLLKDRYWALNSLKDTVMGLERLLRAQIYNTALL